MKDLESNMMGRQMGEDVEEVEERESESEQEEERRAKNVEAFWGTDRVRRVLQRQTVDRVGVKISTAIWRHVYIAIQKEWTKDKGVGVMLDEIYEGKGKEDISARRAKLACPSNLLLESISHSPPRPPSRSILSVSALLKRKRKSQAAEWFDDEVNEDGQQ